MWESPDKPETLLHVPYGYMLLLQGDVVHAGGLPNESKAGPAYTLVHCFLLTDVCDIDPDRTYIDHVHEYSYHEHSKFT